MSWKKVLKRVTPANFNRFDGLMSLLSKNMERQYYSQKLEFLYPRYKEISFEKDTKKKMQFAKEILEEATRLYNSKREEYQKIGSRVYAPINRVAYNMELNDAKSIWLDADFGFNRYRPYVLGSYYPDEKRQQVNLSAKDFESEKDIESMIDTITHESAHRASHIINSYGFRRNPFFEEYLAYLVQYPNEEDTIPRLKNFVHHTDVENFVNSPEGKEFKPAYDEMYVAAMGLRRPKGMPKLLEAYKKYWESDNVKEILSDWEESNPNVSYA